MSFEIGQRFVSKVETKAGQYHRFYIVTKKTPRMTFVSPLKPYIISTSGYNAVVTHSDEVEDNFSFKVDKDGLGFFIGDNFNKKTLQKTYLEPISEVRHEYQNLFDPAKLI